MFYRFRAPEVEWFGSHVQENSISYFLLQCVKINVIVSENLTEKGTNHFIHKIEIF